jgi:sugar-specific transcriptional regulator TrmB
MDKIRKDLTTEVNSIIVVLIKTTINEVDNLELIEALMRVGLTRHESMLYLVLCKEGELTGYEAAKLSGIPRSNAYLALAGLVDKGGAYRVEGESIRYSPVSSDELVKNLKREFEQVFFRIEKDAPQREDIADSYITVAGKTHIIHKMKNIIDLAQKRIYLSLSHSELNLVQTEVMAARDRGLKVVLLTDTAMAIDGVTVYHHPKEPGRVRLIADSVHVLTGELGGADDDSCLYTKNKTLVQLIKDSLTNEIRLIQLESSSQLNKEENNE